LCGCYKYIVCIIIIIVIIIIIIIIIIARSLSHLSLGVSLNNLTAVNQMRGGIAFQMGVQIEHVADSRQTLT
jgi:hypothetical protein